ANNLGMYFINVSGTNFVQSSKVICLSNNSQQAQLSYNEQTTGILPEKSYKSGNSKDFSFTVGDILKLKGISGDYTSVMTVEPTSSGTYTFNFVTCTDGDGNNYAVVKIGGQTWMAENIKTTSYTNSDAIPLVTDNTEWGNLEDNDTDKAYCFYDNDEGNADIYGALYTYAAATNGDNSGTGVQGVCPTGWHVPSDAEWIELTDYLDGTNVAGGKMKETGTTHWSNPNTGATNESGFSALPGGMRYNNSAGTFINASLYGNWWSATEDDSSLAWNRSLYYDDVDMYRANSFKSSGFSVRCVRD
ncbi:MAG: fibrobacter succinogenes major paralogous domain-containing protein, partial [Bacteroidota bacterium]|nr:fibrobacter succinogenes major paralogous domain-containing protein [Bacteroidota bacterium]